MHHMRFSPHEHKEVSYESQKSRFCRILVSQEPLGL